MPAEFQTKSMSTSNEQPAATRQSGFSLRSRLAAICGFAVVTLTSCVIPYDTGALAIEDALEQLDAALYTMRDEAVTLQTQIDSLTVVLRKQDSLLRWVANATGNPIAEEYRYIAPPDTGQGGTPR
jgi:hypothetical protein